MLVHILQVLSGEAELLPRGALTLQYPLAYLPLFPLAEAIGPFTTVQVIYPVLASLAAVPAYLLVRRGPVPALGIISMLFLPDLAVKSLTGTAQGIALPLFLLALYFALRRRRTAFVLAASAILLTHHLTGLITLVLYYTVLVLPRSREPGFIRRELPYLLYFATWPVYWAWTFANTNQSYLGPILLTLVVISGVPIATFLYVMAPHIRRTVDWTGARVEGLSTPVLLVIAAVAAGAGWAIMGYVLESPGLSTAVLANRGVIALYVTLLVFGGAAALARRDMGIALFMATLLALGSVVLALGCQPVFDGLRVADYAVLGGLAALFAPGLSARWLSRSLLVAVAVIVVMAAGLRLLPGYERLFSYTSGERAAAQWIAENAPREVSFASDTKMSLLVLGEGNRNATFEGTWWLFDGSPLTPYVTALNGGYRFRDRPISYVLLSDYMLERGAEVTWFSPTLKASSALPVRLDGLGDRVYQQSGVTIWKLKPSPIAATVTQDRLDFAAGLKSRLYGGFLSGPCR